MTINNNNIFGAFTLGEVRSGRLTGDWLNKESVANYGWFGGGALTQASFGATASVDRIDFSNDSVSASPRGPLSLTRQQLAATGNSNYGWFGGGYFPGPNVNYSSVDRIDFSNDAATASPRSPLSLARQKLAATGNSNYGWFGGGGNPAGASLSTVDRIDFSNDASTASPRGPLSLARNFLAATGNSNYGWFGGGSGFFTVDRVDFSNDSSTASVRGSLSPNFRQTATGNSNYGWFGGATAFPTVSSIDRIDFANDLATASIRGPLNTGKYGPGATGNSNYGWFVGGLTDTPTPAIVATVDRIDFSNDTRTTSPRGALSAAKYNLASTSGVLNIRRQKAGNYGWFGGGYIAAVTATVNRIDFSNDAATASPRGSLSLAREALYATGNSNYGWFGGGQNPTPAVFTRVDRIDFSNDSPAGALSRGPLNTARSVLAATGNSNYGWFGGGYIPGTGATGIVDRIDFSNDSATASVRGPLSSLSFFAATGNSNYGWFGGGNLPVQATVNRINFSNDVATASTRGPLTSARFSLAATGNSNYGWFGGGATPTIVATVDRIDFSNDSVSAVARGPLSSGRYRLAATGNSNYGWFGGGGSPGAGLSTVERIDFSNDSVQASLRGGLSPSGRFRLAATSNTTR